MPVRIGGLEIGFPLPIVKPLVPSGIRGPLGLCFIEDASKWIIELLVCVCGLGARSPRLLCVGVRDFDFPRARAHPFFEFSSPYQKSILNYSNLL